MPQRTAPTKLGAPPHPGAPRRRTARRPAKPEQIELFRHGGRREHAGRKPAAGVRAGVSHSTRDPLHHAHPVHITLKVRADVGNLRTKKAYRALRTALTAGKDRFGFRAAHYCVQRRHVHLISEAQHRVSLSRGVQGLAVRIAKRLNKALGRSGRVFADRYHARALTTPREVRNALCYVLNNARRHREWGGQVPRDLTDYEFSSAPWFDGWAIRIPWQPETRAEPAGEDSTAPDAPVAEAQTWLLCAGWRRRGLIDPSEVPGPSRA